MAGKGGYQAPAKPAQVATMEHNRTENSAANKLTQAARDITNMPNWGDAQDMSQIQSGANMAATPDLGSMPMAQPQQSAQGIPPQGFIGAHQPSPTDNPLTPIPTQQQQAVTGIQSALSLLNSLGDNASPQVKQTRNVLAAHLMNQSQAGQAPTAPTAAVPPMAGA
jgi:hypothetical protein